jgi:predicted Zn-dependent protease
VEEFYGVVIPTKKIDAEEMEAVLSRAAKVLRAPLELRDALPVPQGIEDTVRGQFRAATLMTRLKSMVPQLRPGKLVGAGETTAAKPRLDPGAHIFITDVDMFTEKTDGLIAALLSSKKLAVISVRRLREAFYRRKADPVKQRARVVKELLRMAGRLRGLRECADPKCVLASSRMLADIDMKDERYCRTCEQIMFEGTMRL